MAFAQIESCHKYDFFFLWKYFFSFLRQHHVLCYHPILVPQHGQIKCDIIGSTANPKLDLSWNQKLCIKLNRPVIVKSVKNDVCTVCPRSSNPSYIVSYYTEGVTTSWTYSTSIADLDLVVLDGWIRINSTRICHSLPKIYIIFISKKMLMSNLCPDPGCFRGQDPDPVFLEGRTRIIFFLEGWIRSTAPDPLP